MTIRLEHLLKRTVVALIDSCLIVASHLAAWYIHYNFDWASIPPELSRLILPHLVLNTVIGITLMALFGLYSFVWHFYNIRDAIRTALTATGIFVLSSLLSVLGPMGIPFAVEIVAFILLLPALILLRSFFRIRKIVLQTVRRGSWRPLEDKRLLIFGAGEAGQSLLREIQKNDTLKYQVMGLIDDNRQLWGSRIDGVKVLGGRDDLVRMARRTDAEVIFLAIPSAPRQTLKAIIEICHQTDCELKTLPSLSQLITGEVSVSRLRDVRLEDLLGREPVQVNLEAISSYLRGKVVLVTGGGGSIGSELCRQIASQQPRQLIIVDIYENNAYELQMELTRAHPELDLVTLISSVRDSSRMDEIFRLYRPQLVFHAAAHKHVPLMEDVPNEAVKNNVFGTWNVAGAADRYGAERFVLISTDKAINPTNVMGATKRVCEMVIQYFGSRSETVFAAVRFGNVLGSNGSVIPLFRQQIEQGGPVTVTDKRMVRYFMTVPEAASLVLEAGGTAQDSEIFVLDMGEPVVIDEMARTLIRLSGYVPDVDIKIAYTGLRPGEKLYEEPLMDEEYLRDTENARIHIGSPLRFDMQLFERQLDQLQSLVDEGEDVRPLLQQMVPGYRPLTFPAVQSAPQTNASERLPAARRAQ